MEAMIANLANELLDKVAARGGTRMDVVDDFSYPIPVSVIFFRVLGVPMADEPKFHGWVTDFMQGADVGGPERDTDEGRAATAKAASSMVELNSYVHDLVERLSREPAPGLLSAALHDDGPDGPVSKAEAESNAQLLLVAGHDSTVNTISNCVMTLLRNQGSWELVRNNPELIPGTVEEVQRLQGAVQFFPSRWATADIEIGGTRIPAGSAVFLVWAAANRDPRRFVHPRSVRSDAKGQRTPRLWQRHPHLFRRTAGAPGDQRGPRDLPQAGAVSPPTCRRSSALSAQPGVPRAATSLGGFRGD